MDRNYTIQELAEKLKVSQRTILREIQRGKIKASKVGRRHLIAEKELKRYLEEGETDLDKNIKKYINSKKGEMINLLQKMVSMASDTNELGQEGRLANFIKTILDESGIRSVLYKEKDTVAIRGSFGYADEGILLDCPLDTVSAGDIKKWSYPPFEGVIKGGRMYGRGVADCKAGIVAMIYAVLALKEYVDEEKVRVELVFDGGEQSGSYNGMKLVLSKGLPVEVGIVGYAGEMSGLPIGARGYHRYTFKTSGKAVHTGARYKKGVNAISKMVKFISLLERKKLPKPKGRLFSFGNRLTFSIIEGGRAINILPDECKSRLDVRTTPEVRKAVIDRMLVKIIKEIKTRDKDFDISWKYDVGEEGFLLDRNLKIIKSVRKAIKEELKKDMSLIATGPAHIGNLLYKRNIPVVVWGPKGENFHSYDEYVEINSIPTISAIYAQTVLKYFGVN